MDSATFATLMVVCVWAFGTFITSIISKLLLGLNEDTVPTWGVMIACTWPLILLYGLVGALPIYAAGHVVKKIGRRNQHGDTDDE